MSLGKVGRAARRTVADIPGLTGKRAIVTGATSGIGLEAAAALAGAGAEVLLTGRNPGRGERALDEIRRRHPAARIGFALADQAELASIAAFAAAQLETGAPLDILLNNAGVMGFPQRRTTADGFEMQFGTNHLGHFALTAQLLPVLLRAGAPRVVTVASLAHRRAALKLDNLQSERRYSPYGTYAQSKLANLVFALELARRCAEAGSRLASIAAHPGFTRTNLFSVSPIVGFGNLLAALVGQPARMGALPLLYAATSPEARNGGYYGPTGPGEMTGSPGPAWIAPIAADTGLADALWRELERVTRVVFPKLA